MITSAVLFQLLQQVCLLGSNVNCAAQCSLIKALNSLPVNKGENKLIYIFIHDELIPGFICSSQCFSDRFRCVSASEIRLEPLITEVFPHGGMFINWAKTLMLLTWKAILIFVRSNRLSSLITVKFTIYLCRKHLPVGAEFVDPNSNTICWTLNNNMLLKACSGLFFLLPLRHLSGEHIVCVCLREGQQRKLVCKDESISRSKCTAQWQQRWCDKSWIQIPSSRLMIDTLTWWVRWHGSCQKQCVPTFFSQHGLLDIFQFFWIYMSIFPVFGFSQGCFPGCGLPVSIITWQHLDIPLFINSSLKFTGACSCHQLRGETVLIWFKLLATHLADIQSLLKKTLLCIMWGEKMLWACLRKTTNPWC